MGGMTKMTEHNIHTLIRTNKKGVPFRGKCVNCGKEDLKMEQMWEECSVDSDQNDNVIGVIEYLERKND